jgi:tetratricopeptide (TPR) repeat protein
MPNLRCFSPILIALVLTARASAQAPAPPDTATAWFNRCALAYNAGKADEAIQACDKSIAIDPTRANAWFIKGSALFGQGTLDKANHYVLPPGTLEALRRYLALAPDGPHAADVKAMLDAADQK